MAVYVTGDTHGSFHDFKTIKDFCLRLKTTKDDFMIILGDAGINYYLDKRDERLKKYIDTIPITFICLHGNHEARPESLSQYKKTKMFGDIVYTENKFPSIIFIVDGGQYKINNISILSLGGAYSVDKFCRICTKSKWFEDEQTDKIKRNQILKQINGKKYDYVLSHTCPLEWEPIELFLPFLDQDTIDDSQEKWLSEVKKVIDYKKWYFGHFHGEKISKDNKYEMLFNNISKLI